MGGLPPSTLDFILTVYIFLQYFYLHFFLKALETGHLN